MSLRAKTLTILAFVMLALLGAVSWVVDRVVMGSFDDLEQERIRAATRREVAAVQEGLRSLERDSSDWASWDDTYEFMEHPGEHVFRSNLSAPALTGKGIELILFVSPEGEVVAGKAFDLARGDERPVPTSILPHLASGSPLNRARARVAPLSGLLSLPEGLLLVSARPILTSYSEGPPRGTFVMGRFLRAEQMAGTDRAIAIAPWTPQGAPGLGEASRELTSRRPYTSQVISEEAIAGFHLLPDVYGEPAAVVEVREPRPIHNRGRQAATLMLAGILAAGLFFAVLTVILLETQVLGRVRGLADQVRAIEQDRHHEGRLSIEGRDELARFAALINGLLDAIAADQERLGRAKDTAEVLAAEAHAASEAKSLFLANMSHEVRTPLNGVIAMADLLVTSPLTAWQRECVVTMRSGSDALLAVINDILDFSKIEAGRLEVNAVPMDVRSVVEGVATLIAPQATGRGVAFERRVDPALPPTVAGDPARLRQVLLNLLSNAVKFTEQGRIGLTVAVLHRSDAVTRVRLAVTDTGIGIAPEDRSRLFAPFAQGDPSTTRRFGGTGLGLAISAQLVALMGGNLEMESAVGEGSTFWFDLDLPTVEARDDDALTPEPPRRAVSGEARLLVAEDNPINRKVVQALLEHVGVQATYVADGAAAVEAHRLGQHDLILMDVQMPGMDGFTAIGLIRQAEAGTGRHVPIVALTAHAMRGDRERCIAAGADDYLPKPLRLQTLRELLGKYVGVPNPPST